MTSLNPVHTIGRQLTEGMRRHLTVSDHEAREAVCGIVINPDAAANMGEGAIVDGIGNAFFGEMPFKDGVPQKNNFNNYKMIRMGEAPKAVEVHFVKNNHEPTGLGEPLFPPIFGAVANALYKATGQRYYEQPFGKALQAPGLRM
jgi:isoquinoline 1-oxidoreductase subunit beta